MRLSAVSKRYADALADVVTQSGSPLRAEDAVQQLRSFESALAGSRDLREILVTPATPIGRKKAVVGRIAEILKIAPLARNFLFVLIDHRRIASLSEIIDTFDLMVDERLGFARAEVSAAHPLSDSQRAAVGAELERRTGKRIRMKFTIDESLIGGVTAKIGSTVFDGSVRGQLQTLERSLGAES
jgi:F-type H+-transporting ATPase subunit delta